MGRAKQSVSGILRVFLFAFLFFAVSLVVPAEVFAQSDVEEGVALLDEGAFEGALRAFARAEASDDLSTDDLVTLLSRRASVYLAIDNQEAMRQDLAALSAIRPDFAFGQWAPPSLLQAYEEASGPPLELRVEAEEVDEGTQFSVSVSGDPGDLVRSTQLFYRTDEDDTWTRAEQLPFVYQGEASCEYYVEVLGPGGAVIARDGSESEPYRIAQPADEASGNPYDGEEGQQQGGDRRRLWWTVGGVSAGVVVVTVVVVVAVLFAGGESDQTAFGPPAIRTE